MKICGDCFGKLWPGLVAQAIKGKVLHIEHFSVAGRCDYCGIERRIVFEAWFEGD